MANLRFSYRHTDSNPSMPDPSMDHYKCTLFNDGRQMVVFFSKGSGHKGAEPTLDEVLECLASDCAQLGSFEDWCSDFGFDSDSRKAERTYNAIVKQEAALRRLLGDEFDSVLEAQFAEVN